MIMRDSTPHASVFDAANQAGSFHFSDMKEALSFGQQVDRLREHGITVTDDDEAAKWLSETNYYRISGYWLTLEHDGKIITGTTLNDIREIYLLDEGLRLWLWKAIEPVEIKARTAFAYHMSLALGPLAHENPDNFTDTKAHRKSMDSYHRERGRALRDGIPCVTHNMNKYGNLPAWAAVEIMSMGTVSRLVGNLSPSAAYPEEGQSVRDAIADEFGTTYYLLKSWLRHLTYVRNLCGHHNRIYNRSMTTKVTMLKKDLRFNGPKAFPSIITLLRIYENLWPDRWDELATDLIRLFDSHPTVDIIPLGFPSDWKQIIGPSEVGNSNRAPNARLESETPNE